MAPPIAAELLLKSSLSRCQLDLPPVLMAHLVITHAACLTSQGKTKHFGATVTRSLS